MNHQLIVGYIDPKKSKPILFAVPILHNKEQKIFNPKNMTLPFKNGTEIDFIIKYIQKINGKNVLQTQIIKEKI